MDKNKRSSRISRPLVIVAVVILLIGGGIVAWNSVKYKFIKGKVKTAVYEKTKGLYTIRYDNMDLDEVGGFLHVTNLQIIPDTAKFRQMVESNSNPAMVVAITVPDLTIAGVKTPDAMLGKKVNGRKLEINNATVQFYFAKAHPDTSTGAAHQEMYQQLLGDLNEIQVDTVEVNNVSLAFSDIRNNKKTIEGTNISVHLKDVLIDSAHSNDTSRFFFSKRVEVMGEKAIVKGRNNTYFYTLDHFAFNNEGGLFSVKAIQIIPQLSEDKFATISKIQKDRFNVSLRQVSLSHIKLQNLMEGDVLADQLTIKDADVKVYRDRSFPADHASKVGSFPQQLLMRLPNIVALKKLVIADAYIEYKEKNPKSEFSGKVQFVHANATITNVTNDPDLIKLNKHCVLDFNSRFLDMADMHAHLDMILKHPKGAFTYRGSMDGFEGNKLNVLIEPMGLAKVEKGRVNKVNFNFSADNYKSDGQVTLLYDDLKITVLKKDDETEQLKKKKLLSFIANIVVKNSNPSGNKPARVATVHYERDPEKSFFNLMWKSVFVGVKQTVGM